MFAALVSISLLWSSSGKSPSMASMVSMPVGRHHWLKSARHGTFLYNLRDTYIGQSLHHYGEWSEFEVRLFAQFVRRDDWVLDIGANIGGFTVPFAAMVGGSGAAGGGGGMVWAIEPQRALHQLLDANVALNEAGATVRTFNAALGAEAGTVEVPLANYSVEANFGGVSLLQTYPRSEAVPLYTLDALIDAQGLGDRNVDASSGSGGGAAGSVRGRTRTRCPTFIKIDVEGMEIAVLRGARQTLRQCRPVLYVENNCKKDSPPLIQLLDSMGYTQYWDLQPYFNPDNFFNNSVDIFTDAFMSYNVLAVPQDSKYTLGGFTRIHTEENRWFVHQYDVRKILPRYHTLRKIEQNGDMQSCTR